MENLVSPEMVSTIVGGVTVTLNAVSITDTGMTCNVVLGYTGGNSAGSASLQAIAYR